MSGILDQLLYEPEGTALDFKESQYLFYGADDKSKSELLKDILAFANSFRRTEAYILIGVREKPGARSIVMGVTDHLKDADLQQFVNSKTNRAVDFSYTTHQLGGHDVGVIRIPLQERPIYLLKDFGKLFAEEVYLRRGSSTDKASLDEIAKMGGPLQGQSREPELALHFVEEGTLKHTGETACIHVQALGLPQRRVIPDYSVGSGPYRVFVPLLDKDYYRDCAEYLDRSLGFRQLLIMIENGGEVPAYDVVLRAVVDDPASDWRLLDRSQFPDSPSRSLRLYARSANLFGSRDAEFDVSRVEDSWVLSRQVGKIQPKASAVVRGLFVGAKRSCTMDMHVSLFADNLAQPVETCLQVQADVSNTEVSVEELLEYASSLPDS